jgi:UMF1 family MFS transporter
MYDWANSAFATTVMAGFFPIFFKQYWSYGVDVNMSTAQLGFGNSLASLFVALMAPFLGAIADKGSAKKKFLLFFAYLGVLMTAGLFLVHKGQWGMAIFVYVMGIIGFSGANVFYDAILPGITGEDKIDYVSSLGFSMGYLGGGLLFLINVLMTLMPQKFGLPDATAAVRVSFLSVARFGGVCSPYLRLHGFRKANRNQK